MLILLLLLGVFFLNLVFFPNERSLRDFFKNLILAKKERRGKKDKTYHPHICTKKKERKKKQRENNITCRKVRESRI